MSLFADDVLVYLTDPEQSLVQLFSLLEQYGSFSGYKHKSSLLSTIPQ